MKQPKYPIYIPSKGRVSNPLTIRLLLKDDIPFRVAVEPQEAAAYETLVGKDRLFVLPKDNQGLIYSRNCIRADAVTQGAERHWQWDDDIRKMYRLYRGRRIQCSPSVAIAALEDFTDRYENIGISSFNSCFFIPARRGIIEFAPPPFSLNFRCYTCFLMQNSLPCRWRFKYNEDTDMTLQVLALGLCTVMFNAFLIDPMDTNANATGQGKNSKNMGGQATVYEGDGRLQMARQLERVWPGVVTTRRRFGRPQHRVNWKRFDQPLIRRKDIDWDSLERGGVDEMGMQLKQLKAIKSQALKDMLE